jgi:hypothetical protein
MRGGSIDAHDSLKAICHFGRISDLATTCVGDLFHFQGSSQRDVLAAFDNFVRRSDSDVSIFDLFAGQVTQPYYGRVSRSILHVGSVLFVIAGLESDAAEGQPHRHCNLAYDCQEYLWCC